MSRATPKYSQNFVDTAPQLQRTTVTCTFGHVKKFLIESVRYNNDAILTKQKKMSQRLFGTQWPSVTVLKISCDRSLYSPVGLRCVVQLRERWTEPTRGRYDTSESRTHEQEIDRPVSKAVQSMSDACSHQIEK